MARMTLLEMTRNILSEMSSDTVDSYTDTVESQQVAEILVATYYQIIDGREWPHLYRNFRLNAPTTGNPTKLGVPTNVMDIKWIKYNVKNDGGKDVYKEIPFVEPEEFTRILDGRDNTKSNVQIINDNGEIFLNIYNDRQPTMWTTFYESNIYFDSYNAAVESPARLASSKSVAYGKLYPNITVSDSLVFDLPIEAFSFLLEEAKSVCFLTLKQMAHPKAEQHAVTHRRRMSREAWIVNRGIVYPSYGRRPR